MCMPPLSTACCHASGAMLPLLTWRRTPGFPTGIRPFRRISHFRRRLLQALLRISGAIDRLNERLGTLANVLVLLCCIVSAANAMIRYAFDTSSNGWLEAQWYMFAVIVMLGASYTLKRNEHVRVEIFYL